MSSQTVLRTAAACAAAIGLSLLVAPPLSAGNGHFIHGVGATNSSMGGAGAALPNTPLGALAYNPALLTELEDHRFEFGVELVATDTTVSSTVETPFGPIGGRTEDDTDLANVPSFAWSRGPEDGNTAFGVGFLAMAGFGTDYPQDPTNPILAPQPQGFGSVFSSYRMLRMPAAVAWRLSDRLSLGLSLNLGWASLEARPFGGAAPDCSSPVSCFFPTLNDDSAIGYGATLGLHYRPSDAWAFAAAYHSEMSFEEFEWNTTVANPDLPTFGTARRVEFTLDSPEMLVLGTAWRPNDRLSVALDGRWIGYEDTQGFGRGFDPRTGAALGLGWDDITVLALGVELRATPAVALRAGYNRSDSAVPPESAFGNVASPAVFEDHLTLGLGWQAYDALEINLGVYRVFENEVTGPFVGPQGPVPGTSVTNTMQIDSGLLTFTFHL